MRSLLLVLTLSLSATGFGQRCEPELRSAAAGLGSDASPGIVAAQLLATAVQLVEPALPPLLWSVQVPLQPAEDGYEAVRYLAERGLLPASWLPQELSPETWSAMLSRFLAWYDLEAPTQVDATGAASLVSDLSGALDAIGEAIRPLALIASASHDRSQVAFLGRVWNWTVYPRLIVMQPRPEQTLNGGVRPLLDEISNCAVQIEHYVFAPEDTARKLFLSHSDARMYVIGSEPSRAGWPQLVPEGEEEAYFSFASPEVDRLDAYSAVFDGSELGIRELMGMMPRLRTNLPPTRIPGLLRSPQPN